MEAIQLDGDILFGLLKKNSPAIYKHLKSQGVDPILYMTEWFLCVFARTLPWPSVLRVWDMFCCEGVKVLFRVGLVLLRHALPRKVNTELRYFLNCHTWSDAHVFLRRLLPPFP